MGWRSCVAVVVALAVVSVARGQLFPTDPGYHNKVPVPAAGGHTAELYIPKATAASGALRPVVFVMGGHTAETTKGWLKSHKLPEWAESSGAVLIGVNEMLVARPRPGEPPLSNIAVKLPTEDGMDAYMAMADALPGVHPSVRIVVVPGIDTAGELGWGQKLSWALAKRYPTKIAGIVLIPDYVWEPAATEGPGKLPEGISVCVLRVTQELYAGYQKDRPYLCTNKDVFAYDRWEKVVGDSLRDGKVTVGQIDSPWFSAEPESMAAALDRTVDAAFLQNKGVAAEQRATVQKEVADQLQASAQQKDMQAREESLRFLLTLPGVAEGVGSGSVKSWREAVLGAADAKPQLLFRYQFLKRMSENPLMKGSAEAREVAGKMAAIEADGQGKSELAADKRVRELQLEWKRLGIRDDAEPGLKTLLAEFQKVEADYPKTIGAAGARDYAKAIERTIADIDARQARRRR